MFLATAATERLLHSLGQLLFLLLIFAVILFLAYVSSRFAGNAQKKNMQSGNLEVLETIRIGNNKHLQIVRAGERYFVIGLGKDEIEKIGELDPADFRQKKESDSSKTVKFTDVLGKLNGSSDKSHDR